MERASLESRKPAPLVMSHNHTELLCESLPELGADYFFDNRDSNWLRGAARGPRLMSITSPRRTEADRLGSPDRIRAADTEERRECAKSHDSEIPAQAVPISICFVAVLGGRHREVYRQRSSRRRKHGGPRRSGACMPMPPLVDCMPVDRYSCRIAAARFASPELNLQTSFRRFSIEGRPRSIHRDGDRQRTSTRLEARRFKPHRYVVSFRDVTWERGWSMRFERRASRDDVSLRGGRPPRRE